MIILRLLLVLSAAAVVVLGIMYLLTRNPRYPVLARRIVVFVVSALLVFAALFVLERYVLSAWRVLL